MSQLECPAVNMSASSPDIALSSKIEIHRPSFKEQRVDSSSTTHGDTYPTNDMLFQKETCSNAADDQESGRPANSSNAGAPADGDNKQKNHSASPKGHHPPLTISIDNSINRFKRMKSFQRLFGGSSHSMATSRTSSPSTALSSPMFSLPSSCTTASSCCMSPTGAFISTPSIIRQYPPKPLQYSVDISPAPELLKTRRSCTLRTPPAMVDDHPASQARRSSAPLQQQETRTLKRLYPIRPDAVEAAAKDHLYHIYQFQ
ncbi:hypothetical protein BCR43DRAFT_517391 [Syncephalastrum racemosum]|uniref:Uncharacterized protein n=1 Tax=Syncephalastrum racemosum TaxID=13706 RepID=A0A1X2H567_SYNRA|nr:hypothetical protein BCR43DRAFT_517391 [Syncephalastrum racemosum]